MIEGQLAIYSETYEFQTEGDGIDLFDLTPELIEFIKRSGIGEGRVTIFVNGAMGAIIATEFEPFLIQDTKRIMAELIKTDGDYRHDKIEDNTHSHLRSTLLGPEMTIPVINGKPSLGAWQQVVFADLDTRPRSRQVVFQIMGLGKN